MDPAKVHSAKFTTNHIQDSLSKISSYYQTNVGEAKSCSLQSPLMLKEEPGRIEFCH